MRVFLKKLFGLFLMLQALFVLFGLVTVSIPNKVVKKNIETSVELYGKVHQYDKPLIDKPGHQSDNFMDFLMLNMMYNSNEKDLKNSFLFPSAHFIHDSLTHVGKHLEYSFQHQDQPPEFIYGRYWHGSMFVYKYMFLVSNLSDVRWMVFLLCTIVLFSFAIQFYKHFQPAEFYLSLLALIFVNYYMVFHSLQFTPAFVIALIGATALLKRIDKGKELYSLFLIVGACTAYFDLLTIPALTVGLPLLCWALKQNFITNFAKELKQILCFGSLWVIGFIGTWAMKWILIALFTDYSIIGEITSKFVERGGVWKGSRLDAIVANFEMLNLAFLNSVVLVLILLVLFVRKSSGNWKKALLLILIAITPLAWIFATSNHAEMHNWFVYRCLMVTIAGVFLALAQFIDWEKLSRLLRLRRVIANK